MTTQIITKASRVFRVITSNFFLLFALSLRASHHYKTRRTQALTISFLSCNPSSTFCLLCDLWKINSLLSALVFFCLKIEMIVIVPTSYSCCEEKTRYHMLAMNV